MAATHSLANLDLSRMQRADRAARMIAQKPDPGLDMLALAQRLNVSRRQLERDFRQVYGVGPIGYARQLRFDAAMDSLARGLPIAQVASLYGFCDQAHFTRTVRQMTGLTPGNLRRKPSGPPQV